MANKILESSESCVRISVEDTSVIITDFSNPNDTISIIWPTSELPELIEYFKESQNHKENPDD